ncbi:DUF2057 family protein [Vibrio sp. YMD68]|uniref:DUF2057 family protein n=1 Tax=Vibrio sp. YMD68 TaxID=3042300 RepID=UPI00249C7442|nr:DUF2057 family protein [Vibrio sp. YMD68]WGV99329.1 DUF2057 family protein [Vibrio sp. YMD68]
MNKIKLAISIACMMAFSTNAATLIPAKGVSILYINGQEADAKIGKNKVLEGETQLIVRMDKELGRGNSKEVFTSDPYVVSLVVTGDELKINHPVARSTIEAESAFKSKAPQWRITQDGAELSYSQEPLPKKKGMLPFMGLDTIVSDYNEDKGIFFVDGVLTAATVAPASVAAVATTTAVVATSAESKVATDAIANEQPKLAIEDTQNVDQLKAWYLKASKSEKKEFRRWMIDQE